jgi:NO-binding membrane sensor protein with MHYT domain
MPIQMTDRKSPKERDILINGFQTGQLAVAYFILKNKTVYVICAIIIAICAATAALLIFFKLREQWANQWYKRLGCAMLMGVAVCGMI